MKRKVSRIGPATLMVSLPSKWVKKYGLKKGDEINLEDKENKLIISTAKAEPEISKITVDVSGMDDYILQLFLTAVHKKGFDEVSLRYDDPRKIDSVRVRISTLLGYEVVEQRPKYCRIRNVSGDLEKEYDSLLRRSFLVNKNLFENVKGALESNDFSGADSMIALEKTNNRLTNYCERILVKKLYKGIDSFVAYVIVWNIESIADDLRDLIKDIVSKKKKVTFSKEFIKNFGAVMKLFDSYYSLFYSFSIDGMNNLKAEAVKLKSELSGFLQKEPYSFYLMSITSRIYDMMASTLSINMSKYVENEPEIK
ncbi:AbrB/MazE/SpoVT family DNA-binding domain-containing protein [Candidatus Woesearchaeota archaeon]|nr:AbrB/MazE/SpoVT family DNA-binding domain-containing protein [Candidatus Woesearchaeota archaeon]